MKLRRLTVAVMQVCFSLAGSLRSRIMNNKCVSNWLFPAINIMFVWTKVEGQRGRMKAKQAYLEGENKKVTSLFFLFFSSLAFPSALTLGTEGDLPGILLPGEHLPHLGRGHRSPGLPSVPSHSVYESSHPGRAPLSRRH